MNAAYVSALSALAGSVIGGLTTFAAAWVTQRQQANVQWSCYQRCAAMMDSGALDPLHDFSEMCRDELSALVAAKFLNRPST